MDNSYCPLERIIGTSEAILKVKERIRKVAGSRSTVCINGESGTGKELFARALHDMSDRRDKNFVAINCAAIPESLLESELFGYEEGAFTGAKKGGKIGKFELANGGTLFLDEVAELQLNLQAKLLRVLQNNTVDRIGGSSPAAFDARIVVATNKELHKCVKSGLFREDLFYRLTVIPIRIPPLRDRKEDIMLLAYYFLDKLNCSLGKNIKDFNEEVKEILINHPWHGNVRELQNTVEYAVNMTSDSIISRKDLSLRFQDSSHREDNTYYYEAVKPIEELIRLEIKKALDLYGKGSEGIEKAAMALGISVSTMYRRIKKYDELSS